MAATGDVHFGTESAEAARQSLGVSSDGFQWAGGRVSGNLYVGRQSAGGFGTSLDLNGDDKPEVTFDAPCSFLLQDIDDSAQIVTYLESTGNICRHSAIDDQVKDVEATGLYLDVSGYSYSAGAPLTVWYQTDGQNQQFFLGQLA